MSDTVKIPRERLHRYFEDFSKRFLRGDKAEAADIEVVNPEWGDQIDTDGVRLEGITYEDNTNTLDFALDVGDHRVYQPKEVWVVEEAGGFVSSVEVVRPDGGRDVVMLNRSPLKRLPGD